MAKERFSCLQDKSAIEIHIDFMYKKTAAKVFTLVLHKKGSIYVSISHVT